MLVYRLMEKVKVHLVKVAEAVKHPLGPDTPTITHALLETYSRLLVWLGTRNFQSKLIPSLTSRPCEKIQLFHASESCISSRQELAPSLFSLCSPADPSSVQEPGVGSASRPPGTHQLSGPSPAPVLISLPAPAAAAHGGFCHHHP